MARQGKPASWGEPTSPKNTQSFRLEPVAVPEPPVEDRKNAPPVKAPAGERFFLVAQTAHVPRLGTHFTLPAGKVISSAGYDIEALRSLGVPLEEVASGVTPRRARLV